MKNMEELVTISREDLDFLIKNIPEWIKCSDDDFRDPTKVGVMGLVKDEGVLQERLRFKNIKTNPIKSPTPHNELKKQLWMRVVVAYVASSNSMSSGGASKWANKIVDDFDDTFKR